MMSEIMHTHNVDPGQIDKDLFLTTSKKVVSLNEKESYSYDVNYLFHES